jgi:hypothetical protein
MKTLYGLDLAPEFTLALARRRRRLAARRALAFLIYAAAALAFGLMLGVICAGAPALPPVPQSVPPPARTFYFAATALDGAGHESAPSTEVAWTNTGPGAVTLGWTPSISTNVAGYKVYYGGASGVYTNSQAVGLVTQATINPYPSARTNSLVITVTGPASSATGLAGAWPVQTLQLTNPAGAQFFRGPGLNINADRR